jgi:hypothetical protein
MSQNFNAVEYSTFFTCGCLVLLIAYTFFSVKTCLNKNYLQNMLALMLISNLAYISYIASYQKRI